MITVARKLQSPQKTSRARRFSSRDVAAVTLLARYTRRNKECDTRFVGIQRLHVMSFQSRRSV